MSLYVDHANTKANERSVAYNFSYTVGLAAKSKTLESTMSRIQALLYLVAMVRPEKSSPG